MRGLPDVLECLRRGEASRLYARTQLNHHSSRSHAIFRLKVRALERRADGQLVCESVLNFVDLAGCEKLDVHDTPGKPAPRSAGRRSESCRLQETKYINKSLFFLTQVIAQLGRGRQ